MDLDFLNQWIASPDLVINQCYVYKDTELIEIRAQQPHKLTRTVDKKKEAILVPQYSIDVCQVLQEEFLREEGTVMMDQVVADYLWGDVVFVTG